MNYIPHNKVNKLILYGRSKKCLRYDILKLLHTSKRPLCINEIARKMNVSWRTVEHHILILREYGLVKSLSIGKRIYYVISEKGIKLLGGLND